MGRICKDCRVEIKQGLSANSAMLAEYKMNEFIPEEFDIEKGCAVCNHPELKEETNRKITDMTDGLRKVARRYYEEEVRPQIIESRLLGSSL